MSIEKDLGRIATALEKMADAQAELVAMQKPATVLEKLDEAPVAPTPAPTVAPVPAPPPSTAKAPTTTVAPVPAPALDDDTITAEELNEELVKEFHRLGGREKIDAAFTTFGVDSITSLVPADYRKFLDHVRKLQP